jgi:hypothetical protein
MLKILGAIAKSLVVEATVRCASSSYISLFPKCLAVKAYGVRLSTLSNQMAMTCENHSSAALSLGKCFSLLIKHEIAETELPFSQLHVSF